MNNFLLVIQKNKTPLPSNIDNNQLKRIKFIDKLGYGFFLSGNLKIKENKKKIIFYDENCVSNVNISLDSENLKVQSDDFSSRSFFYYKTSEIIIL